MSSSRVWFALLLGIAGWPTQAMQVRVETAAADPAASLPAEVVVRAVAQQTARGAGLPEPVETSSRPGEEIILDLREGVVWRVEGEAAGFWSEPRWLAPGPGNPSPSVQLRFFRAGSVTGMVDSAESAPVVEVRFSSAPGASAKLSRTSVDCPVQDARFRCVLPAGKLDLRLRRGASIPIYHWSVEIGPGEVRDLGTVQFRNGASVVGWVKTEGAKLPSRDCRIKLAPRTLGPGNDPALQALSLTVEPNDRGFFQFENVSAGTYQIEASQQGLAPARLQPIEVLADLETEIKVPLVLAPPATVRLELDPPLSPSGSIWNVRLQRIEETTRLPAELFEGPVSREGAWEQAGMPPGQYHLLVLGDSESRWFYEVVEVAPGTEPLRIEIPVLRVRGRILLGEEPLPSAVLWFGGRFGPRNARFESDEHGEFEGVLPEEGTWKLDLVSEEEKLRLPLAPVEVRKKAGASFAWVEVVLPDTRLQGEVVDGKGRPLDKAAVVIFGPQQGRPTRLRTDREGKFEIRGLYPGPVRVQAEAGNQTSDWLEAELEDGAETPPLRLVVREKRILQGQVFSPKGPVPGARIQVWPSMDQADAGIMQEAISDRDGFYSIALSEEIRSINLAVAAPGHAFRMFRTLFDPEKPLDVPLEPFGGTLILDFGDAPLDGVLVHGGVFAHAPLVKSWAQGQRGKLEAGVLTLPSMEPGDYWYCPGNTGIAALRQGQPIPTSSCVGGSLAALSELVLEGDEAKPESPSKGAH